jgi:hypothetical protein
MKKQRIQIAHAMRERMADTFSAGYKAGAMAATRAATRWHIVLSVSGLIIGSALGWAVAR